MKLPKITTKQQELLKLLYRYRFADRIQIQVLMHHKDRRRIGAWLKDLRDKEYVEWIYSTDFAEKTKPAIYYLGINGVRFLKTLDEYPVEEVRKRYREYAHQKDFIARSLLIVDSVISLEERSSNANGLEYSFAVRADYIDPNSDYHFLHEPAPDLYYEKHKRSVDGTAITSYLVTIFDATLPRYMVKKRLKEYVTYLYDGEWKDNIDSEELAVHIACPTKADLIYAKRRTRLLLEDIGRDEATHIRFSTTESVQSHGVTGIIWEEV